MENLLEKVKDLWKETYLKHPNLRGILANGYAPVDGYAAPKEEWPSLQRDILFIGMNPSYNEAHGKKADLSKLAEGEWPEFPGMSYDTFTIPKDEESVRYFKDLKDLIEQSHLPDHSYEYMDLFAFRLTDQKEIKARMRQPGWTEFLCRQLTLADFYIREIVKPRMIVVMNAEALDFLGLNADETSGTRSNVWMGYRKPKELDQVMGMYKITSVQPDLNGTQAELTLPHPIFILPSSILTYTATHTKVRLAWAIRRGYRLLAYLPKDANSSTSLYELLELVETWLADVRHKKMESISDGNYAFAARDRDRERELLHKIAVLASGLE